MRLPVRTGMVVIRTCPQRSTSLQVEVERKDGVACDEIPCLVTIGLVNSVIIFVLRFATSISFDFQ